MSYIFWLSKNSKFSKIYIYYAYDIYKYTKAFLLDKGLRKKEIGKQTKWNGSTEYEIEKVEQTR